MENQEKLSVGTSMLTLIVFLLSILIMITGLVNTLSKYEQSPIGYMINFPVNSKDNKQFMGFIEATNADGRKCLINPAWLSISGGSMLVYGTEIGKMEQLTLKVHWLGGSTNSYQDCGKDSNLIINYNDAIVLANISGGWIINGEKVNNNIYW